MLPATFAMLVILALAVVVIAVVVFGMQGTARYRIPEVSHTLARAGQHLNGEAEPPRGLIALFEEAGDNADDLRQLPSNIRRRSAASAASAKTALSARTASGWSARSARSAATPAPLEPADPALAPEFGHSGGAPAVDSAWGSSEVQSAWGTADATDVAATSVEQPDQAVQPRRSRSTRWFRPPAKDADLAATAPAAAAAATSARSEDVAQWGTEAGDRAEAGPRDVEDRSPSRSGWADAWGTASGGGDELELAEEFSLLAGLDDDAPAEQQGRNAWAVWSSDDED